MTGLRTKLGLIAVLTALLCSPATARQTEAWFAAKIWTGAGEPIQNAVLVVVDGKVQAVGPRTKVAIPSNATRHELGSQNIMPGMVIGQTDLIGPLDAQRTLTPQNLALDGFDFFAEYDNYLKGGVTSVQLSPGSDRLLPGVGAAVKLTGEDIDRRTLSERESLRVVLDSSSRTPPRIYEPAVGPVAEDRPLNATQPQISKTLVGSLAGLRLIFRAATDDNASDSDEIIDAVRDHLKSAGVVRFNATTAPEIRGAISLAREFDLKIILADCVNLKPFVDDFSDWSKFVKGVVLSGRPTDRLVNVNLDQTKNQIMPWESARELIDAGIPVAISPSNTVQLGEMLFVAGQFMQDDLSQSEIVTMLSSAPAKIMGISNRVGMLEKGNDADFIVLSGEPSKLRTAVTATFVDGKNVFDRAVETTTSLVSAGSIYVGDGKVIDNGSIVVKGKTIRGLGNDVSAPIDSDARSYPDGVIVPGFVDLGSGLGIGGTLTGNISLQTKLGDQLYPDDPAIKYVRQHGITTVLLGSNSGNNGTPLVAFKLGDDARVIKDPVAIRYRVSNSPSASITALERVLKSGKAYHDSFIKYEKDLAAYKKKKAEAEAKEKAEAAKKKTEAAKKAAAKKAGDKKTGSKKESENKDKKDDKPSESKTETDKKKEKTDDKKDSDSKNDKKKDADKDKKEAGKKPDTKKDGKADAKKKDGEPKKPKENKALEPYRSLFAGDIPAFVEARSIPAIKEALKLFVDKYKIRTVIVGADDLARDSSLLKGYDVGVCAGPNLSITVDDQRINLPQVLANERLTFGFQTRATTGAAQLPGVIQHSVSRGLGVGDGLSALTSSPAALLSEKMTFGHLTVGSDADLVVLSGPPFEHATKVLAVMIDGVWVYQYEEQE